MSREGPCLQQIQKCICWIRERIHTAIRNCIHMGKTHCIGRLTDLIVIMISPARIKKAVELLVWTFEWSCIRLLGSMKLMKRHCREPLCHSAGTWTPSHATGGAASFEAPLLYRCCSLPCPVLTWFLSISFSPYWLFLCVQIFSYLKDWPDFINTHHKGCILTWSALSRAYLQRQLYSEVLTGKTSLFKLWTINPIKKYQGKKNHWRK